jgi:hypothetical protein
MFIFIFFFRKYFGIIRIIYGRVKGRVEVYAGWEFIDRGDSS